MFTAEATWLHRLADYCRLIRNKIKFFHATEIIYRKVFLPTAAREFDVYLTEWLREHAAVDLRMFDSKKSVELLNCYNNQYVCKIPTIVGLNEKNFECSD